MKQIKSIRILKALLSRPGIYHSEAGREKAKMELEIKKRRRDLKHKKISQLNLPLAMETKTLKANKHFFFKLGCDFGKAYIFDSEEEASSYAKEFFETKMGAEAFEKVFVGTWHYKDQLYYIYLFSADSAMHFNDIYLAIKK